eukprot:TRINITY_DN29941_c0_g1_i4.p1 TRINITY_DN29941_c0_g1~~TRINITY_DN29941_c0_g1_i4.p1  ORF type:complete len:650 (-),score=38.23 TRINITY_DN29941_c0_g1_i4:55-1878(-)
MNTMFEKVPVLPMLASGEKGTSGEWHRVPHFEENLTISGRNMYNLTINATFEKVPVLPMLTSDEQIASGESHEGSLTEEGRSRYIIVGGQLRRMSSCSPCGKIDLCNSTIRRVSWSLVARLPRGGRFDCAQPSASIIDYITSSVCKQPCFAFSTNPWSRFVVHGRKAVRLISCEDCGPLYGNLCKRYKKIGPLSVQILQRIGGWPLPIKVENQPFSLAPVFECHRDVKDMLKPIRAKRWLVLTEDQAVPLAISIRNRLEYFNFNITVMVRSPASYASYDAFVILGVRSFEENELPPLSKSLVVQLEQNLSTESPDSYFRLLRRCLAVLENKVSNIEVMNKKRLDQNLWYVPFASSQFLYYFSRVMLGLEIIPISRKTEVATHLAIDFPTRMMVPVVLTIPESPRRHMSFLESTVIKYGPLFSGARQLLRPTWVSAGLSFSMLASLALRSDLNRLAIAEDDCVFPPDFESKAQIVEDYLDSLNDTWDMFSGLIADVPPDANILSVAVFNGTQFVTIDRMLSMVYNVYNKRLLSLMSTWDAMIEVDRYLERQPGLKVVVMLPYLVGHRASVYSTIWGTKNDRRYTNLIRQSEQMLLARRGANSSGGQIT